MHTIALFLEAHPALLASLMAIVIYQPLSAIYVTIFRLQPPEVYARFAVKHPALAQVWRIVGGLGVDPVVALTATKDLLTVLLASKQLTPPSDKDSNK